MPIYKQYVDYFENKKGKPEQISLLTHIKDYEMDNSVGVIEQVKSDLHILCSLFEEFLESTEEGRKFIKDKVEYYQVNNTYYEEKNNASNGPA